MVLLSWLAGEVASHRQKPPSQQPMEGGGRLDRHTVAKTTIFEWACSWNAARWQLYNRRTGGVRLWRGSDKRSSGEAVEFFFHCPLFIYIPQLRWSGGILTKRNTQIYIPALHRKSLWKANVEVTLTPLSVTHSVPTQTGPCDRFAVSYKRYFPINSNFVFSKSCVGCLNLQLTGYLIPWVNQQKWFSDCVVHPAARAKSNLAHTLPSRSQKRLFCAQEL